MTNTSIDVSNMSLTDTYDMCTSCTLKVVNSLGEGRRNTVGTWLDQFCLRDQGEKTHQIFSKFASLGWGLMFLDCFMNQ